MTSPAPLPPEKRFQRIHAICVWLRDKPCEQCPRHFKTPYGMGVKGCYVKAREAMNIVRHGYPWKPPYNERQLAWRKRWNRE